VKPAETIVVESTGINAMKTLDRSRPFGTICGGSSRACFEQDGLYFDSRGVIIGGSDKQPDDNPIERPVDTLEEKTQVIRDLAEEGKTPTEIRKMTGFHHKTIEKYLKCAESTSKETGNPSTTLRSGLNKSPSV
jgi:hypothetical protein